MSFSTTLRFPSPSVLPQPPPSPCPWLWRCHQCHIVYRLATTRRCLECDHEFCVTVPGSSTGSKKRKRGGPCKAEFDYIGWAEHGAWRRTVLLNSKNKHPKFRSKKAGMSKLFNSQKDQVNEPDRKDHNDEDESETGLLLESRRWVPASSLTHAWGDEHRALNHGIGHLMDRFAEKKEALFIRSRHNCWLHCDFPSECHHAVYKAQNEGRPVLAGARAVDEAYIRMEKARNTGWAGNEKEKGAGPSGLRGANSKLELVTVAMSRDQLPSMRGNVPRSMLEVDTEDDDSSDYSSDEGEDSVPGWPSLPRVEATKLQEPVSPLMLEAEPEVGMSPATDRTKRRFTAIDPEGDYSYDTFKKSTVRLARATPTSSAPAPYSASLELEHHMGDSPISPVTSSTNAEPTHTHISVSSRPFESVEEEPEQQEEEELDAFLASLYTTAAQHRRHHAVQAQLIANPLPSRSQEGELSHLQSFTPYESFHDDTHDAYRAPDNVSTLEDAYSSQQSWFPPSSSDTDTDSDDGAARRKRARRLSRERMLTLLGRRTSLDHAPEYHQQQQQQQPLHLTPVAGDDSWESDSSSASAGSSASGESDSTTATSSASDTADEDGVSPPSRWSLAVGDGTMAGDDGLVLPRFAMPTIIEEGEEDEGTSGLLLTRPLMHKGSGDSDKQDRITLTRMRYEFMMGKSV